MKSNNTPNWVKPATLLSLLPIFLIWAGSVYMYSYYSSFGIDITDIMDLNEYITSFLPMLFELNFIVVVVGISATYIYIIFKMFKQPLIEWQLQPSHVSRIIKNIRKKKIRKTLKYTYYLFIGNKTVLLVYLLSYSSHYFTNFNANFTVYIVLPFIIFDLASLMLKYCYPKRNINFFEFNFGMLLTILFFIVIARFLGTELAKDAEKNNSFIAFEYKGKPVKTNDTLFVLGTPKKYIILRDKCTNENYFYNRDFIEMFVYKSGNH